MTRQESGQLASLLENIVAAKKKGEMGRMMARLNQKAEVSERLKYYSLLCSWILSANLG